jgi:hypothetical protein
MKRYRVGILGVLVLCVATYAWGGVQSDSADLNPAPAGTHDPGGNYLTPADQEMLRQFGPLADKITGLTAQIATHGGTGEVLSQFAQTLKYLSEGRDGNGEKLSREVLRSMFEDRNKAAQLKAFQERAANLNRRLERLGQALNIVDTGFKMAGHLAAGDTSGMLLVLASDLSKFVAVSGGGAGGLAAAGPLGAVVGAGLAEEAWVNSGQKVFEMMAKSAAGVEAWNAFASETLRRRAARMPEFIQYLEGSISQFEFKAAMQRYRDGQERVAAALQRLATANPTMKGLVDAYGKGVATDEQVRILEGALNAPLPIPEGRNATVAGGAGTGKGATTASEKELLDAICRCSGSCTATSFYSTEPVRQSPSCEDPANGPCVCAGMGCLRSVMSPACIAWAYQELRGGALGVKGVTDFIRNTPGASPPPQDPVTVPPLVRKGEALQMTITVPGRDAEKWLWQSADGVTFRATRQTLGAGSATETVTLQQPSMAYLVFRRESGGEILAMREPMNGGFMGGIMDDLPQGSSVAAYMIPDPNPQAVDQPAAKAGQADGQPVAPAGQGTASAAPAGAGRVDFAAPGFIEAKGQWGIFEAVSTPMTMKGRNFRRYFLQHPGDSGPTAVRFALNGGASRLRATVGIDQSLHPEVPIKFGGTAQVSVTGDGKMLWSSGVLSAQGPSLPVDIDVRGVRELVVVVDDAGDGTAFDWLVWADPVFE